MATLPKSVSKRLSAGIKKYKARLIESRKEDKNEADTVRLITGMLCEIFGYDEYSEITAEQEIRNTYCDLAVKLKGKFAFLIEAKSAAIDLKDPHVDQAINYATNQGIDWVILTNGLRWNVYRVTFSKPIGKELIVELDFEQLNFKVGAPETNSLFMLTKEGWNKSILEDFYTQKKTLDRFLISALMLSPLIIKNIRKELKKISPKVKLKPEQIQSVIEKEVLKRELLEGQKAEEAHRRVRRMLNSTAKMKKELQ